MYKYKEYILKKLQDFLKEMKIVKENEEISFNVLTPYLFDKFLRNFFEKEITEFPDRRKVIRNALKNPEELNEKQRNEQKLFLDFLTILAVIRASVKWAEEEKELNVLNKILALDLLIELKRKKEELNKKLEKKVSKENSLLSKIKHFFKGLQNG